MIIIRHKPEGELFLPRKTIIITVLSLLLFVSSIIVIIFSFMRSSQLNTRDTMNEIKQNTPSPIAVVVSPRTNIPKILEKLPSIKEVKQELGEISQIQLDTLRTTAESNKTAADYLRLAVAYELISDFEKAAETLHLAILLAPRQRELYEWLGKLPQAGNVGVISVFINGSKVVFKEGDDEVNPVMISSYTLVPIRKITEKLGAWVSWDPSTLTATIRLSNTTLQLTQDSTNALVNGHPAEPPLVIPAKNIDGRILVPLRFVGEQFGKFIDYIPGNYDTAIITILDKQ